MLHQEPKHVLHFLFDMYLREVNRLATYSVPIAEHKPVGGWHVPFDELMVPQVLKEEFLVVI